MIATLHLTRPSHGLVGPFVPRASDLPGARFVRPLHLARLTRVPAPVPSLVSYGVLVVWEHPHALHRFRTTQLGRRLRDGRRSVELTLEPIKSHGAWDGTDPFAGATGRDGDGPVVFLTQARTRALYPAAFWRTNGDVVRRLSEPGGAQWSLGFADRLLRTLGTVSWWPDMAAGTAFAYGAGVHQQAIRASRHGGWLTESWFGRARVVDVAGTWPGLPALPSQARCGPFAPGPIERTAPA